MLLITSQIGKNPSLYHRQLVIKLPQNKSCKVVFSGSWYYYVVININCVIVLF